MNYNKIYDDLMSSRLELKLDRIKLKKEGEYFEGHHIIPKCKGGLGNSNRPKNNTNIVLLTAREHFLAHWLLWRIYRDRQMALAFSRMLFTTNKTKRISSSRGYTEAREAFRETNIGNKHGCGKKRVMSDEQKLKISQKMKGMFYGDKNPFYNKKHTEETKQKLRDIGKTMINERTGGYMGKKILIKNDVIIGYFDSAKEVADFIGCSHGNVRNVLGGSQKTAKGYIIKHSNEDGN
jgi:hypothetical protein